jgi:hypothetical protein
VGCRTKLYKYQKDIPGHLLKVFKDRIIQDHTRGDLKCPKCNRDFARHAIIQGRPANKIIQGKVYVK